MVSHDGAGFPLHRSWLEQLAKLHVFDGTQGDDGRPLSLWTIAQYKEVYPRSKLEHFKAISRASGIPCSDMILYDDEPGSNREVTTLGACFQEIPSFSETGTTIDLVIQGLEAFQLQKGAPS